MSGHSEGEWIVRRFNGPGPRLQVTTAERAEKCYPPICELPADDHPQWNALAERDAPLLAAAKEMRDALRGILESPGTTRRDTMEGDEAMLAIDPQDITAARKALRKAEGRAE